MPLAGSMPERVLVTGGTGYLGSHVCKALARSGYLPVAFDRAERIAAAIATWGPLEDGDLTDVARLREVIRAWRPVGMIHTDGMSDDVAASDGRPTDVYRTNVAGVAALVGAMFAEGLDRLVLSSSSAVYGASSEKPVAESAKLSPITSLGVSKTITERIVADLARQERLAAVALRCFTMAGADPEGQTGAPLRSGLVSRALDAVRNPVEPMTIFGTDHPTPDGTCIRDFVHVSDLARAHVSAFGLTGRQRGFHAYNLGTGHGTSVRDVLWAVEKVTGQAAPWRTGLRRTCDPAVLVADCRLARKVLGWQAELSDIETILSTEWAWIERASPHGRKRHGARAV
jgi:UDP-arabinose 4-epimerase